MTFRGVYVCVLALASGSALAADWDGARWQAEYGRCQQLIGHIERLKCFDGLGPAAGVGLVPVPEAVVELALPPADEQAIASAVQAQQLDLLGDYERRRRWGILESDDPNYFNWVFPTGSKLGDEQHLEFYLSVKSPIYDRSYQRVPDRSRLSALADLSVGEALAADRVYLHYNGLYDFYVLDSESSQYDSAPIISKRQNPGLSAEWDWFGDRHAGRTITRMGWFHESNGQQFGPEDGEDRVPPELLDEFYRQQATYTPEYALSQVSRGWDYAMFRVQHASAALANFSDALQMRAAGSEEGGSWLGREYYRYSLETRLYCDCQGFGLAGDREDAIWWQPGNNVGIEDYDGLRLSGEWGVRPFPRLVLSAGLDLQTSLVQQPFQYVGGRLTLGALARVGNWRARLNGFYFNGYGRDPSTYHLSTEYWGIGFEFR